MSYNSFAQAQNENATRQFWEEVELFGGIAEREAALSGQGAAQVEAAEEAAEAAEAAVAAEAAEAAEVAVEQETVELNADPPLNQTRNNSNRNTEDPTTQGGSKRRKIRKTKKQRKAKQKRKQRKTYRKN